MAKEYSEDDFTHMKFDGFTQEDVDELFMSDREDVALEDLPQDDWGVYVCNNCGAQAETIAEIEHHSGCKPGEADKWAEYYEKAALEDEDDDVY